jgi:hypothetical protein
MAARLQPSKFPDAKHRSDIRTLKDPDVQARVPLEIFRELWNRGCIEVDNLPMPSLKNATHPVFVRERFQNALTDGQYASIEPAVKLASRFITERSYLDFWVHLVSGVRAERTRTVDGKRITERYIAERDLQRAQTKTRKLLREIAACITWFNTDKAWSNAEPIFNAETFMDRDDMACKRWRKLHNDDSCGSCKYCEAERRGVCAVCRYPYYTEWQREDVLELCKEMGWEGSADQTKAQLVRRLQQEDDLDAITPRTRNEVKVSAETFNGIRIGLHHDVIRHLRECRQKNWTQCEEMRFQFSLAGILVHELAHAFYPYTQRQCWSCNEGEPWWSADEVRYVGGPELGNSWEIWAFGSRVPDVNRARGKQEVALSSSFCRGSWSHVLDTEQTGVSRSHFELVAHELIVLTEYTSSWFQESTWGAIARKGRLAGRPNLEDSVILSYEVTELLDGTTTPGASAYGPRRCSIEEYDYRELVKAGGFQVSSIKDRSMVYGKRYATSQAAKARLKHLKKERGSRVVKPKA